MLATTSGGATSNYFYGNGADRLAVLNGGVRTWYGTDNQGSVRQTLSDVAAVLGSQDYDPYGTPEGGTQPAIFGYTGELQDAATSAVYLRARWYQPGTGTLLGVDPMLDTTGQAYAYAGGDPVNGSDPSGLCDAFAQGPFGVSIRLHVWGTVDNHVLCNTILFNKLKAAGRSTIMDLNSTFNEAMDTDFVNTVYGDTTGLMSTAKGVYEAASYCKDHPNECENMAATLAIYAQDHPGDLLQVLGNTAGAEKDKYVCEVTNHRWGALAGDLLFDFVTMKGGTALTAVFKDASDATLLTRLGTQAARNTPRGNLSANVWGTLVHTEWARMIATLNRDGFRTEVRYFQTFEQTSARIRGEVRLDLVSFDKNGKIAAVYDLKTGAQGLTPKRIAQIRAQLPANARNVPITEIRPQ